MEHINSKTRKKITFFMIIGSILLAIIGLVAIALPLFSIGKMSVVTTNSMSPAIHKGSLIFTTTTSPSAVSPGDIITISSQNDANVTVSRIETISSSNLGVYSYTLREDNSFTPDPWLHKTNSSMQKVVFTVPVVGWIILALSHPVGGLFVVALITVLAYLYTVKVYEYSSRKVKARREAEHRLELMSYGGLDDLIELFDEDKLIILNDEKKEEVGIYNEA